LLAGNTDNTSAVIYKFDDACFRGGMPVEECLYPLEETRRAGDHAASLVYPWYDGLPVLLLWKQVGGGYNAFLRELDTEAERYTGFVTASVSSAGCTDHAFSTDDFGAPAILVSCGINGADAYAYEEIGDADGLLDGQGGQWIRLPGNRGNLVSAGAHRGGDYAFALNGTSNNPPLFRYALGQLSVSYDATSVHLPLNSMIRLRFQQDGQRALVVGREFNSNARVLEYRHPLFTGAEITVPSSVIAKYSPRGVVVKSENVCEAKSGASLRSEKFTARRLF